MATKVFSCLLIKSNASSWKHFGGAKFSQLVALMPNIQECNVMQVPADCINVPISFTRHVKVSKAAAASLKTVESSMQNLYFLR